ncbi:MAG TPA: bifunctional diguanylate cyclase/phosphodiesterase [Rhizomicrobium sp.]|nr:bifunctional diguanylate cyclase/phosphodiesterase [Rhizomicrobium sp.]
MDLLQKTLHKGMDARAQMGAVHENARLRLASQAARVVVMDWQVADDRVQWDGATDILPFSTESGTAQPLLETLTRASRDELTALLEGRSPNSSQFELNLEVASALGAVGFTFAGTRVADSEGRAERMIGMLRETTEKQREIQRLTYLATRDELTGHLNRNALRIELQLVISRAMQENRNCAILVASIDRLAMINDGYGFDAGDEVIVGVGERVAKSLRVNDVIGRTAGNKFGVILRNCTESEIASVATRLKRAVRDHAIDTKAGKVFATISVGAVWLPLAAANSQDAMLRAEQALERARANGRDGFAVYAESRQRETARLRQMGIADEVVQALKEDRIRIAYQPIIEAGSRRATHYECLLRMLRPDGKVMNAGYFVPAAEQMGIVHLVDRFALETAVDALARHSGLVLSVNVSGTAASDPAWLQGFVDYVKSHSQVASRLQVELTETASLSQFEENAHFVSQLRDLGVKVAIDDFGAGYTSFRNLQLMHVDVVKIDGSYVKNLSASLENQVFVRTLTGLAKNFDMKVVAEWVGSDQDAALLESFGVDYFQGYYFGEPDLKPTWSLS